jgi:hypothetical protein
MVLENKSASPITETVKTEVTVSSNRFARSSAYRPGLRIVSQHCP